MHRHDFLRTIDRGLHALDDDAVREATRNIGYVRRRVEDAARRARDAMFGAKRTEHVTVVEGERVAKGGAHPLHVRKVVGQSGLGQSEQQHFVDGADGQHNVDPVVVENGAEVGDPFVGRRGAEVGQLHELVAGQADGGGADRVVVGDDDAGADGLQGAHGVQGLGLTAGRDEHRLAVRRRLVLTGGQRRGNEMMEKGLNEGQDWVEGGEKFPQQVGYGEEQHLSYPKQCSVEMALHNGWIVAM